MEVANAGLLGVDASRCKEVFGRRDWILDLSTC